MYKAVFSFDELYFRSVHLLFFCFTILSLTSSVVGPVRFYVLDDTCFSQGFDLVFTQTCAVISSSEDVQLHQSAASYKVESPVETKENEAQSISNLLPDEDDLFSGIIDKMRCSTRLDGSEDEEDLFQSGGGMELEADTNGFLNDRINSNGSIATKHTYGEKFSRTLLVTNISTSIEDSELRSLLEVRSPVVHKLKNNHEPLNFIPFD